MTQRRMLNKSISQSMQVDQLNTDAQLLFTWMIPHADDEGRLNGNPQWIKGMVVPLKSGRYWSLKCIENYLLDMEASGLIYYWYQLDSRYIEFPSWKAHQTIQLDRVQLSKIPAFDSEKAKDAGDFPDIEPSPTLDTRRIQEIIGELSQYKLTKDNIIEFKLSHAKLAIILRTLKVPSADRSSDPRINQLKSYFIQKVQEKKGFLPVAQHAKEGFLLKRHLLRFSETQIQDLIDCFLESDAPDKLSCSLSVCLSGTIINQWLAGKLKKKIVIAKLR